jgi:hypothetical protein
MTVARDELMSKDFNPKFDALRNAIYHSSRRRFFELLNRSLSFLVVISGTAAVANLHSLEPRWLAAMAAIIGALQLVFDFGGRARIHEVLQRRYFELGDEKMGRAGKCWDEAKKDFKLPKYESMPGYANGLPC